MVGGGCFMLTGQSRPLKKVKAGSNPEWQEGNNHGTIWAQSLLDGGNSRGLEVERSLLFRKLNEATVAKTQNWGGEKLRGEARDEGLTGSCRTQQDMIRKLDLILSAMGNHWRALGREGTAWCMSFHIIQTATQRMVTEDSRENKEISWEHVQWSRRDEVAYSRRSTVAGEKSIHQRYALEGEQRDLWNNLWNNYGRQGNEMNQGWLAGFLPRSRKTG